MEYLDAFLSNKILWAGVIGWASAQVLKTIIFLLVNKKLQLERLFGDGGMPSGHSATVMGVAVSTAIECGLDSPLFAIAMILAIVVMHDAMGVRRETGKQAKYINELVELIEVLGGTEVSNEEKLKEFVGHTPLQVLMGAVLGTAVALIMCL